VAAAAYLFFYKRAGAHTEPRMLAYALLLVAAVLNSAFAVVEQKRISISIARPQRLMWWVSGLLALLTISGNWCSAEAISHLEPAVTSLLLRTEIVFVGLFGVALLGERVRRDLAFGGLTALLGLLVMRWPLAFDSSLVGVVWALGGSASFALMQVITRRVIHRIAPGVVNAVRLWIAVVLFSFQPGVLATLWSFNVQFWGLIAAAALLGPVVGRLCIMYSLRSLTAAHSALLLLLSPVFALAIGAALGGAALTRAELWGGSLMLVGIAWPSASALRRRTRASV
jgi:drug/metabolite transporter (DMT)-like permease